MPGVRVPRRVHRDPALRDVDVVVYAALLAMRGDGQDRVTATLEAIGARTGRGARSVGAALDHLLKVGYVSRRRSWPSRPYTYRLAALPEREGFDVITFPLMASITDGVISDGAVRTWLVVDQALGWHGRTTDTACELAQRRRIGISTLRAHVDELLSLDALEVQLRASRKGWSLIDPAIDFTTGQEPAQPEHDAVDTPDPGPGRSPDICGSPAQISDAPCISLPPKSSPPGSSELCSDRSGSDPGDHDDGLRPKKKISPWPSGGVYARPGVLDVLEVLDDVAQHWTRGPARRWLGGIASAIATVVDHTPDSHRRLSPAAATTAIVELGDGILEDRAGRHVAAIRDALAIRAREVRQGLACSSCGLPYGPDVHGCPWCVNGALPGPLTAVLGRAGLIPAREVPDEAHEGALPPLQQRLAAYQQLGVPLEQIRTTDPEAAAALTPQTHPAAAPPRPCRGPSLQPMHDTAEARSNLTRSWLTPMHLGPRVSRASWQRHQVRGAHSRPAPRGGEHPQARRRLTPAVLELRARPPPAPT